MQFMSRSRPPGRHVPDGHEAIPASRFDLVLTFFLAWANIFGPVIPIVVGFTVCVGIPVGLFAEGQTFLDGLVIGAVVGLAVWGVVGCVLIFVGVAVMGFEAMRWVWHHLAIQAGRGDKHEPPR